jgi:hypothetical protein
MRSQGGEPAKPVAWVVTLLIQPPKILTVPETFLEHSLSDSAVLTLFRTAVSVVVVRFTPATHACTPDGIRILQLFFLQFNVGVYSSTRFCQRLVFMRWQSFRPEFPTTFDTFPVLL